MESGLYSRIVCRNVLYVDIFWFWYSFFIIIINLFFWLNDTCESFKDSISG